MVFSLFLFICIDTVRTFIIRRMNESKNESINHRNQSSESIIEYQSNEKRVRLSFACESNESNESTKPDIPWASVGQWMDTLALPVARMNGFLCFGHYCYHIFVFVRVVAFWQGVHLPICDT